MSNFKKRELIFTISFIIFFVIVIIYKVVRYYNEELLLKQTKQTTAVIIEIRNGSAVKSTATASYYYHVNKIKYNCEESKNFNDLDKGDTVLIKYSIREPSIARVVDKYYMRKYWHLKK